MSNTPSSLTDIWIRFTNRCRAGEQVFSQELVKEASMLYPCRNGTFKRHAPTLIEATLLYYNIEPSIFLALPHILQSEFLSCIDSELQVYSNLVNFISWEHRRDATHIEYTEFMQFLSNKGYGIPAHFSAIQELIETDENESSNFRQPRLNQMRKEYMRYLAQAYWNKEKSDLAAGINRKKTHPALLAKQPFMRKAVKIFNDASGLAPRADKDDPEEWVDPDWFSDLCPWSKPGPKSRSA